MGRRIVDQELWDALLAAFREEPGNILRAARLCGVTRPTARRAWETGWPNKPWAKVSIKDLVDQERDIARSRLEIAEERAELEEDREALAAEADRERSRQQAIKAKEEEGKLVQLARGATLVNLNNMIRVAPSMAKLIERLGTELLVMADKPTWENRDRGEASSLLRRFALVVRELNAAGHQAMEMERLFLGEPSQIIGVVTDLDRMSMEELTRSAGYTDGVLQRAAKRGLVVLDGGRGKASGDGN